LRNRLKKRLSDILSTETIAKVYNSFDIIGDIAIIKTSNTNLNDSMIIADQIFSIHKNVKSVFLQISAIKSDYRTRELKLLAGEYKTVTKYKESGCIIQVDIEKCFFSPRLSYERARIAKLVKNGETVINMFSGVGCFSIIVAKTVQTAKIFSIDLNPSAVKYLKGNILLNHVYGRVHPLLGDAKEIIETQLLGVADRILMPLPGLALRYLSTALLALKPSGGWIHYHSFEHATANEDPIAKSKRKVAQILESLGVEYRFDYSKIVRSTGPNWWHVVIDISVTRLPNKF
jgi:tRNA (guanine37-N1)-methyltransferase